MRLQVVLSEWTDMSSLKVDRSLHSQTDWFGIRKNAVQSYADAIQAGAFRIKLQSEWKRMVAMDVSDVSHERFLINGAHDGAEPQLKRIHPTNYIFPEVKRAGSFGG